MLLVPGYQLLRQIGQGGMGEVYLASQLRLGRDVAVKVLKAVPAEDTRSLLGHLEREATLMASVNHPHLLTAFDFALSEDGRPCLIMEYIANGDLRQRMTPRRPMPVEAARTILDRIAQALNALHEKRILHRDLKPENVLMLLPDHPKVADFGIALPTPSGDSASPPTAPMRLGTVGYVSPEQRFGLPMDERSDQFSFAALAYEMLTGELPLGRITPASELNPAIHPAVDPIILKALDEDPDNRYDTLTEFNTALQGALTLPSPSRHRRLLWAAAAAMTAVLLGSLLFLIDRKPAPPNKEVRKLPENGTVALAPVDPPVPRNWEHDVIADFYFDALTRRATKLWIESGRPEGSEQKDWYEACRQSISNPALARALKDRNEKQAYDLWLAEGKPEGRSVQHFLAAREAMRKNDYLSELIHNAIAREAFEISRNRPPGAGTEKSDWEAARRALLRSNRFLPNQIDLKIGISLTLVPVESRPGETHDSRLQNATAYYVSLHEVTIREYRIFLSQTGYIPELLDASLRQEHLGQSLSRAQILEAAQADLFGDLSEDCPVVNVTWNDATEFTKWLSTAEQMPLRLGTALEWELAQEGGPRSPREAPITIKDLHYLAWTAENAEGTPHQVGRKARNGLGIHDMLGNVSEWCLDGCNEDGSHLDQHLALGGSFTTERAQMLQRPRQCLPAATAQPSVGFRVFRPLTDLLGAGAENLPKGAR